MESGRVWWDGVLWGGLLIFIFFFQVLRRGHRLFSSRGAL